MAVWLVILLFRLLIIYADAATTVWSALSVCDSVWLFYHQLKHLWRACVLFCFFFSFIVEGNQEVRRGVFQ